MLNFSLKQELNSRASFKGTIHHKNPSKTYGNHYVNLLIELKQIQDFCKNVPQSKILNPVS